MGWLMLALVLLRPAEARATTEDKFDVLQVGTRVYTNVTVTTKAKNYIFILHANGMNSIKTADLSPELLEKLGYENPEKAALAASTNTATAWAKAEVAKIENDKVREVRKQMVEKWEASKASGKPGINGLAAMVPLWFVLTFFGIFILSYLFHSYCSMLICRKAGHEPGVLVWLPIVQMIPMFRAAGMSPMWLIAMLIPGVCFVPIITWCFKIAAARGKSVLTGILLLLPITSFFAFLYLAFSSGSEPEDDDKREPEIMSLQTA